MPAAYLVPKDFADRPVQQGLSVPLGDRLALPRAGGIESVNDEDYTVTVLVTTPDQDRDGDILDPMGCEKHQAAYLRNPVTLWEHNKRADTIPPATCISWQPTPRGVIAKAQFDPKDPDSLKLYQAIKSGRVRGVSIGFRPLKWSRISKPDVLGDNRKHGYHITEWEPLEWSFCGVQSNPHAVVLHHKSHSGEDARVHGLLLKSMGLNESSGPEGGFMADMDTGSKQEQKKESFDKSWARAMRKALGDADGVLENNDMKACHKAMCKAHRKYATKAYADEDWGWPAEEGDGDGDEAESKEKPEKEDDKEEASEEQKKSFEARLKRFEQNSRRFERLTGRRIG